LERSLFIDFQASALDEADGIKTSTVSTVVVNDLKKK